MTENHPTPAMRETIPQWVFECAVTDCQNIEEFAFRYRKKDRFYTRGKDYIAAILDSHQQDIAIKGYTCISHHDNVTGEFITFIPNN